MLALLSTALLVSVVLTVPATLLVFTVPVRRHRVALLTTPVAASTAGLRRHWRRSVSERWRAPHPTNGPTTHPTDEQPASARSAEPVRSAAKNRIAGSVTRSLG
ncbi:MAG: hypothetical protein J2P22_10260 [Nocardioides sp.]|nr:hypothetical protein [Nocardioides sp.]